ncbi:MAG: sulfite exporter TauE/SafE family protein [Pseudonocardia sp.]
MPKAACSNSPPWPGGATAVQLGAGALIIAFGLAQLGVPGFRRFVVEPPLSFGRLVLRSTRARTAFAPALIGLVSLLIPCGVTLSVEALALTSGSAAAGAATMAVFVIGTSPLFALLGYAARTAATAWRGLATRSSRSSPPATATPHPPAPPERASRPASSCAPTTLVAASAPSPSPTATSNGSCPPPARPASNSAPCGLNARLRLRHGHVHRQDHRQLNRETHDTRRGPPHHRAGHPRHALRQGLGYQTDRS